MRAMSALFLLLEHFEDEGQELRGDALSSIANANHRAIVFFRQRNGDLATGGSEFQRVEEYIPEDLLQAIAVGVYVRGLEGFDDAHCDVFLPGYLGRRFHGAADDVGQAVHSEIEREFAACGPI